jgi:hypothetical protein
MTRRVLLLIGATLGIIPSVPRYPHPVHASGTCPELGHDVEPVPRDVVDLMRKRLIDRLERYAGPSPAVVRTLPDLHPPGGKIAIRGKVFFFEVPSVGDPEFPYLWRIDAYCQRGQV